MRRRNSRRSALNGADLGDRIRIAGRDAYAQQTLAPLSIAASTARATASDQPRHWRCGGAALGRRIALALNPGGLRQLILADCSPGLAVALLLVSFVITFGSTAMGTAIMRLGQRERDDKPPRGQGRLAPQWLRRDSRS